MVKSKACFGVVRPHLGVRFIRDLNMLSGRLEVIILSAISTGAEYAGDPGPDPKVTEWTRQYQALYMHYTCEAPWASVGSRSWKAGTVDVGAVVIS